MTLWIDRYLPFWLLKFLILSFFLTRLVFQFYSPALKYYISNLLCALRLNIYVRHRNSFESLNFHAVISDTAYLWSLITRWSTQWLHFFLSLILSTRPVKIWVFGIFIEISFRLVQANVLYGFQTFCINSTQILYIKCSSSWVKCHVNHI